MVHEGTNLTCEFCGKNFGSDVNLKRHINCVHRGIKNFKCEYCAKQFGYKQDLKKHIGNSNSMLI